MLETLSGLLSLALCGRSAVVWWLVFPPGRKTRAQFPAVELWSMASGRSWTSLASANLALGPRCWTCSGYRGGLVFKPPLASGRSFLDLLWLPGARFWTSSGFRALVFGPSLWALVFGPPLASCARFLDIRWFPGARFWTSSRFWTSCGFRFGPPFASGGLFLEFYTASGLVSSAGFRHSFVDSSLALGGSFLDLLWLPGARFWTSFLGARFWTSSRFWISCGFRAFVFGRLPGARFWTSVRFRGLVCGPPIRLPGLLALLASGIRLWIPLWLWGARFWTSAGFARR